MKPLPFRLLALLCASALNVVAAPKPNVLLICVDDLKPALGCYGDTLAKSPRAGCASTAPFATRPSARPRATRL